MLDELLDGAALLEVECGGLLHNDRSVVLDGHLGGRLVKLDGGLSVRGRDDELAVLFLHAGVRA